MFLLQDVVGGLCTAHDGGVLLLSEASRSNMISSQGAPCFSYYKVELIQSQQLVGSSRQLLYTLLDLHVIPFTTQLAGSATMCGNRCYCSRVDHLLLYFGIHYLCASQASPQKPSRVYVPAMLPMYARLHLSSHPLYHGNNCLPKQQPWNTVGRQLITSDAKSASAGKADAVQAEFAKAGISAAATKRVLSQYKPYLNWDTETKLRPALQLWLQELGTEQLSQQLQKVLCFLLCTPEKRKEVYLWLVSKGVNAARIQQNVPRVMTREIRAVQSTFEALQQAAAFSDKQICTFLHKHSVALVCGPGQVLGTLQVVSSMLDMPMTSESFREFILAASDRLFSKSPVTLHQRVTFFCQMYATGTHVTRTAFTSGVFTTSEAVIQTRAAKLQEQLGWDNEQLKQKLSAHPSILNREPSTLARNVHEMQGAGFSQTQVWAMCTQHPALLCCKWTSDTCVEKLQFLTCLLGLNLDDIAARPKLLTHSVNSSLGPRAWFLYQTGAVVAPNTIMTSGLASYLYRSKAVFSERFSPPSAHPSMVFDSAFIDHWKQRWEFLRQRMKLSVKTIAAHQDLLLASLPDRLAPRWQLLSRLASDQAAFKAEDHLTALATMSDQDFAQAFQASGEV